MVQKGQECDAVSNDATAFVAGSIFDVPAPYPGSHFRPYNNGWNQPKKSVLVLITSTFFVVLSVIEDQHADLLCVQIAPLRLLATT